MLLKAVWRLIEVFLADTAYEATTLHVSAHLLDLVTQLAERVNDQTCEHIRVHMEVMMIVIEFSKSQTFPVGQLIVFNCTLNDGKQDDNNEEEESEIEKDSKRLFVISVWRLDLVTDAAAGSQTRVQMKHEALVHM